ncbi:Hint domain-containing protein [Paracoccus aestuariivivens]|uniref:Hedgehog/Intein (Hint) domain-containing protein n=1 Tax=Paracoccus aestuariivivens TaxID=1820333 RepID=A0A6L6JAG0_9RHOB|nr:Hint domain-containing protein [Paracoccus aestuariivivens]MTH78990.1 hypothetical protein [Paracoccus aestuariivivens]
MAGRCLFPLEIDDANDDGVIEHDEWVSYTGSTTGHVARETPPPALLDGSTGNDLDGTLYSPQPFEAGDDLDVCYLTGTLIATPEGERPVETLRVCDLVLTRDHGPQPVLWRGSSLVSGAQIVRSPHHLMRAGHPGLGTRL